MKHLIKSARDSFRMPLAFHIFVMALFILNRDFHGLGELLRSPEWWKILGLFWAVYFVLCVILQPLDDKWTKELQELAASMAAEKD